ncbi:MAG: hypothetical protein AAFQ65_16190 [Myxococcota bacterium]
MAANRILVAIVLVLALAFGAWCSRSFASSVTRSTAPSGPEHQLPRAPESQPVREPAREDLEGKLDRMLTRISVLERRFETLDQAINLKRAGMASSRVENDRLHALYTAMRLHLRDDHGVDVSESGAGF